MSSKDIPRHSRRMTKSNFSFPDTSPSNDNSSSSATTPIPSTPLRYLGIPFSWEQVPGIPKNNTNKKNESSHPFLPLPPSGNAIYPSPTMKKHNSSSSSSRSFGKDPFLAAFVECSKDNKFDINGAFNKDEKFSTGGGQRSSGGFVVGMSSCMRTCSVSESIVYRRRSSDQDYF